MISLGAFTLLVFVGCALGDQDGSSNCSIAVSEYLSTKESLLMMADNCQDHKVQTYMAAARERNGTAEEFREALKAFCPEVAQQIEACWALLAAQERACLTAEEATQLSLNRRFLQTRLDVFCTQDGDRMAEAYEYMERLRRESPNNRTVFQQCFRPGKDELQEGPNSFVEREFTALQETRKCLQEHPQDDVLVTVAVSLTEELLNRMQCIHPDDGSLVLCKILFS